jgi:hypothetical protein
VFSSLGGAFMILPQNKVPLCKRTANFSKEMFVSFTLLKGKMQGL